MVTRAACRTYVMLRYVGFVVAVGLLAAGWFAVGPWILVVLLVALLVPAARRRMRPNRWLLGGLAAVLVAATAVVVLLPDGRLPIPPGVGLLVTPSYDRRPGDRPADRDGGAAAPAPGANGRSSMHDDGWASDATPGRARSAATRRSTRLVRAGGVRDARLRPRDRLVGAVRRPPGTGAARDRPRDAAPARPPCELPDRREAAGRRPWEDLCAGAYFYLDAEDRAIVATTDRRILEVGTVRRQGQADARRSGGPTTSPRRCPSDDCLVALLPDWDGRIWYVTQDGRVGIVDPAPAAPRPPTSASRSPTRSRSTTTAASTSSPPRRSTGCRVEPRRPATGRLAIAVRPRRRQKPGQLSARQRDDADGAARRAGRDHRQRGPADARAFYDTATAAWSARRRCSARARAPPKTHWSRWATRGSWSRTTTATPAR